MPDPEGQTAVTDTDAADTAQTAGTAETDQADEWDRDRARATILKLREQEKAWKATQREYATLQAKVKLAEDAKLTEDQRLAKRLQELETEKASWERERRDYQLRQAVSEVGRRMRAIDPDVLYRLVDIAEGDEDKIERELNKLKRDRPYLFQSLNGSADGGRQGTADVGASMNDMMRQGFGRG